VGEAEQQQLHEAQGSLRMFAGQPAAARPNPNTLTLLLTLTLILTLILTP